MKAIGIDLGTTNSAICQYNRGEQEVVNVEGSATVPSVVYLNKGKVVVGKSAKSRLLINSDNCLSSTKRYIGSGWTKKIEGKVYSSTEAAEMILSYLKEQIPDMNEVVITIPAYFEDNQREQTMEAAERVGLKVLRLLPEPTAAAISYALDKEKDQTILVVDLGGGTFDVSILEVVNNDFQVKAVDGNHQLGGDDFDLALVSFLNGHIKQQYGKSLENDQAAQQKLKEEAERVKIALANAKSESIFISELAPGVSIDIDKFTRQEFKKLIQRHLDEIVEKTNSVMKQAGMSVDDINRFVLVGGSCKHPLVQEVIEEHFKKPYLSDNMDTSVAEGAAIVCSNLMSLTSDTSDTKKKNDSSGTEEKDYLTPDIVIQDVVSHSLGVDMLDSTGSLWKKGKLVFVPLIRKNTNYPTQSAVIGFSQLGQESVNISVYRGEDQDPEKNTYMGILQHKVPREYLGEAAVAYVAIFELDENGILTFKSVEIPIIPQYQGIIDELISDRKKGDVSVPVDRVFSLVQQYEFNVQETEIDTSK